MTEPQRPPHDPSSEAGFGDEENAPREAAPSPEPANSPEPAPSTEGTRGRRQRRFSISDLEDHRLSDRLEAFLEGKAPKAPGPPPEEPAASGSPRPPASRPPIEIDSRADWNEALRYEAARHERYGRPAAVAVVDMAVFDISGREASRSSVDVAASVVGRVLRSSMRLPDRLARVGPTRFHVLLPETNRADARRFAERARRAAEAALAGGSVQVTLRIAIAAPTREESLAAALATAELQLAG